MNEENQPEGTVPQNQPVAGSFAVKKDNKEDGDKLKVEEKALAGFLLIFFTLFAMLLIVAYWPDRLPGPKDGIKPLYIRELWHVRLACIKDTCCCVDSVLLDEVKTDTAERKPEPAVTAITDSARKADSIKAQSDTTKKPEGPKDKKYVHYSNAKLIDLNILILILVGLGGFLGNMIHIATSFTAFVGAGRFKRSWFLWYFVKPFTAAALAMGLYFVFRAGFLNYSADPAGINLYGVMTVAILAGLFTDRATLKLGEVFEVVFSIKKDGVRPDPLVPPHYRFDKPSPDKLSKTGVNTIVITGDDLDKGHLTFTMGGKVLPDGAVSRILTQISIQYTVPADLVGPKVKLVITDDQKKELFNFEFDIKEG
jgi:hypothetical protein